MENSNYLWHLDKLKFRSESRGFHRTSHEWVMRSYLDNRTRTEFLVRHLAEQNTNKLAFHWVPYHLVINPQTLTTF